MPPFVKILLIVLGALVFLALIAVLFLALVAFQLLFDREPPEYVKFFLKGFMGFKTGEEEIEEAEPGSPLYEHVRYIDSCEKETLKAYSFDGLKLIGTLVKGDSDSKRVVVFIHGFHGHYITNSVGMLEFFHDAGYHVLLIHARGMNDSEGKRLGFGWLDRRDVITWVRKMVRYFGEDAEIIIEGVSMGGAAVMMASGEEDLPKQVLACVEDCGFSSVEEEFRHTYPPFLKWTYPVVAPVVNLYSLMINHFSIYKASSVEQLKKTRLPVFFLHGAEDDFVPTRMVYECYEACPNEKEIMVVPGAGHGMASGTDPEGCKERLRAFFTKTLGCF